VAYHVIVNRTMKAVILYVVLLIKLLNFLSNSYPPVTSSQVANNFYRKLVGEQKPVTASLSKEGFWLCFQLRFAVCYFEFLCTIFYVSR